MPNKKEGDVKPIWTKAQQAYLDDRFGKLEARMDRLEKEVADLRKDVNLILLHLEKISEALARNGIK